MTKKIESFIKKVEKIKMKADDNKIQLEKLKNKATALIAKLKKKNKG